MGKEEMGNGRVVVSETFRGWKRFFFRKPTCFPFVIMIIGMDIQPIEFFIAQEMTMKQFYVVHNNEAQVVDNKTLNSYPFVSTAQGDENEPYSEDWHLYESTGTEWCVAYAENDREAVELTRDSSHGLVSRENVWCEISRVPFEARVR